MRTWHRDSEGSALSLGEEDRWVFWTRHHTPRTGHKETSTPGGRVRRSLKREVLTLLFTFVLISFRLDLGSPSFCSRGGLRIGDERGDTVGEGGGPTKPDSSSGRTTRRGW